tara:strand:+ start:2166 stop:2552 length:387 start_codon:yes stop_codon:yes gene_type:complete
MHKSYGTGRRKTSSARVYLHEGTGIIKINSRDLDEFIGSKTLKSYLISPLEKSQLLQKVDLKIIVNGGGQSGQVGAIVHGLTRALVRYQGDLLPILRREGFVTRDARKVERKKVGLRKARKATQFSKR